jgi:DNA-binding NtrC family response regulator
MVAVMAKSVLVVDDSEDLRSALAQTFKLCAGATVLAVGSLEDLKAARPAALACQVAILDINLGHNQPSGVDVYYWLKENGFAGKIVFFTGHAKEHPLVMKARAIEGVTVFEKPLPFDRILNLLENA